MARSKFGRIFDVIISFILLCILGLGVVTVIVALRMRRQWPSTKPPAIELADSVLPAPNEAEKSLLDASAAIKGVEGRQEAADALIVQALPS